MHVETRHLRALVAVVDEGTFTDAAIALDVSQATVSRTIAALEEVLGARVLHRTARELGLTALGERILPTARRVLADLATIEGAMTGVAGDLRVGYAWGALGARTAELQARWAAEVPGSQLVFVQTVTRGAGLETGKVDVAVLRRPVDDDGIELTLVGSERRYAAVPASDVLARSATLSLHDLVDRTLALDEVTGTTTRELWPATDAPTAIRSTRGVDEWLTSIAAGQGVGVTAEATVHLHPRPGVAYVPLRDAPPLPVWLAWRRGEAVPGTDVLVALASELYGTAAP